MRYRLVSQPASRKQTLGLLKVISGTLGAIWIWSMGDDLQSQSAVNRTLRVRVHSRSQ